MDLAAEVERDPEFAKRYELGEKLGEGGMGTVHRGRHRHLNRPVAVKFMRPEILLEEQLRQRFISEAQTAASLIHPNVCVVLDFGFAGRVPFLVTELVEGQSLHALLRGAAPGLLPPARTLALAKQLLDGLEAIHALGIVHRDLKPANVLIARDTQPKILDFGLAKTFAEGAGAGTTIPGMVVGTPSYMSPEQATGKPLAPPSDLYSFAVILYEMIVGHVPFRADSLLEVMHQHVHDAPSIPDDLVAPVRALLARGLAKSPPDRFASAAEMRAALVDLERVTTHGFHASNSGARPVASGSRNPALDATLPGNTSASSPALNVTRPSLPASSPASSSASSPASGASSAAAAAPAPARSPLVPFLAGALLVGAGAAFVMHRPPPPPAAGSPAPPPSPRESIGMFPEMRLDKLEELARERRLDGVDRELFSIRRFQHKHLYGKFGNEPLTLKLDAALVDLFEMAIITPLPPVSKDATTGSYELLLRDAGARARARNFPELLRVLESFSTGAFQVNQDAEPFTPALHDFLGLYRPNAFDWMLALAVVADPPNTSALGSATRLLERCATLHPSSAIGGWSMQLLQELTEYAQKRPLAKLAEAVQKLRPPAGGPAHPAIDHLVDDVRARVGAGWGGRITPNAVKACLPGPRPMLPGGLPRFLR